MNSVEVALSEDVSFEGYASSPTSQKPLSTNTPDNSVSPEQLVDSLTKQIPWERLPKDGRHYLFGEDFLPYLSLEVKLRLLLENKMAWGDAGHCRKLSSGVAKVLESSYGYGLSLWEGSDIASDLVKKEDFLSLDADTNGDYLLRDVVLEQWLGHYRKFLDKQAKKSGRVAVNLANIPYTAGPVEIKRAVEDLLGWEGAVVAIDPWWQEDRWNHDGTVTVYMPKVAAADIVAKASEGLLVISPVIRGRVRGNANTSSTSTMATAPRKIKAWLAKSNSSRNSSKHKESSDSDAVSQSLDAWA